jgi:hypothetical protein
MRAAARWIAAISVGLALAACVSPSDPWERAEALKEAQRKYAEALRWGNLEKAAHYVDPQMRSDFLALSGTFETVRITDYDIGEVDLDEKTLARAEVDVTYRGYVLPQYVEKRVRDHQVWYRDKESGNEWRVRPELAALLDGIGARR